MKALSACVPALILACQPPAGRLAAQPLSSRAIADAFARQGLRVNAAEAEGIRPDVELALKEAAAHGRGNSKVDFAAVQIASMLGLDTAPGSGALRSVRAALASLEGEGRVMPVPPPDWDRYFDETIGLGQRPDFLRLLAGHAYHPVKISWEDIGRHEGSVWGDRISDVGIWVRRTESDPASAQLALSVRRDSNFRDKVLLVPAEKVKVHVKGRWGGVEERSLPERLRELGLASAARDRNVIVSNQFAIVPVPGRGMASGAPRAAFTFSVMPYGSTNYVITDVIEGSSGAVVGPGGHQLLYAEDRGRKAPFTASRAEDRQDLLRMERDLKARGMDVDVQRYYLIQVPLVSAPGLVAANMGQPPMAQPCRPPMVCYGAAMAESCDKAQVQVQAQPQQMARREGLSRVAIGHGEAEGAYFPGSGWQGRRAEEPIRVTVVYFVTPVGTVTERDMATFSAAFERWDREAIWGGSFVTKEGL